MGEINPRRAVDVVCAGESMAMFVPESTEDLGPGARYLISVAGAESNVAVSLTRLGLSAGWVSRLGEDSFGRYILQELSSRGVDVSRTVVDPSRPTGVAFKDRNTTQTSVSYYRSGSAASELGAQAASAVLAYAPRAVHLTGITAALSDSCQLFVEDVIARRSRGTTLSFDVNWRPALWTDRDTGPLREIAQRSDLVFVGLDEAGDLWGVSSVEDVRDLLSAPPTLVVKRGAQGATVFHDGERLDVPALQVDVVEPVGAGDAFAAGFLAGTLEGRSVLEAARLGTVMASSSLGDLTDIGDLPTAAYFSELLLLSDEEWLAHRYDLTRVQRSRSDVPNG